MGFKKIYSFDLFSTITLEYEHTLYKYFCSADRTRRWNKTSILKLTARRSLQCTLSSFHSDKKMFSEMVIRRKIYLLFSFVRKTQFS